MVARIFVSPLGDWLFGEYSRIWLTSQDHSFAMKKRKKKKRKQKKSEKRDFSSVSFCSFVKNNGRDRVDPLCVCVVYAGQLCCVLLCVVCCLLCVCCVALCALCCVLCAVSCGLCVLALVTSRDDG
jgi:hypothetical protein